MTCKSFISEAMVSQLKCTDSWSVVPLQFITYYNPTCSVQNEPDQLPNAIKTLYDMEMDTSRSRHWKLRAHLPRTPPEGKLFPGYILVNWFLHRPVVSRHFDHQGSFNQWKFNYYICSCRKRSETTNCNYNLQFAKR